MYKTFFLCLNVVILSIFAGEETPKSVSPVQRKLVAQRNRNNGQHIHNWQEYLAAQEKQEQWIERCSSLCTAGSMAVASAITWLMYVQSQKYKVN
jgi:hypothetical protein